MSSDKKTVEISTRVKILTATMTLLQAGDGGGLRMSDIAKAAGVSRQALYLHFKTRADLLIETARNVEEIKGMEDRLRPSRTATSGQDRLDAYIAAWADWIPEVRHIAGTLLAMAPSDPEAAAAINDRFEALRQGCEAAVQALEADGDLHPGWTVETARDLLWAMLGFENWVRLTETCGWTKEAYVTHMTRVAHAAFCRT